MIEHPNYIAGAELYRRTQKDPFFRTDEKSQFSPDITPLILAAHYNSHEIIQMFLSRNQTIDRPHPISCQCADCVTKQVCVKSVSHVAIFSVKLSFLVSTLYNDIAYCYRISWHL